MRTGQNSLLGIREWTQVSASVPPRDGRSTRAAFDVPKGILVQRANDQPLAVGSELYRHTVTLGEIPDQFTRFPVPETSAITVPRRRGKPFPVRAEADIGHAIHRGQGLSCFRQIHVASADVSQLLTVCVDAGALKRTGREFFRDKRDRKST